ncbi:putative membrane protein [Halorubrum sp. AJ67]|nr:putative membrane protein [Halorubrum sp. AJ67]
MVYSCLIVISYQGSIYAVFIYSPMCSLYVLTGTGTEPINP